MLIVKNSLKCSLCLVMIGKDNFSEVVSKWEVGIGSDKFVAICTDGAFVMYWIWS